MPILILPLVFQACKSDGDNPTGPDIDEPDTEEPAEISSSFASSNTSFLPGEIQLIDIAGTDLKDAEYSGELDNGQTVTLYQSSEDSDSRTLIFVVPEEPTESYELVFTVEEQEQVLSFQIGEYEPIAEPESFINEVITDVKTDLDNLIDAIQDEQFKTRVEDARDELIQKEEELSSLSEGEIKLLARVLNTYIFGENSAANSKYVNLSSDLQECKGSVQGIVADAILVTGSLYAFSLSGTVASTGWGLLVGGTVAVISATALYGSLNYLKDDLKLFWEVCIKQPAYNIGTTLVAELNSKEKSQINSNELFFYHNEEQRFNVIGEYEAPSELQQVINEVRGLIGSVSELIPSEWIEILNQEYVVESEKNVSDMQINDVSTDSFGLIYSSTDSVLTIRFYYKDRYIINKRKEFDLVLTDQDGSNLTFETTLIPTEEITMQGTGTEENPYMVRLLEHLILMNSELNANYFLYGDIDAAASANWNDAEGNAIGFLPIGTNDANGFTGFFDGRGHTISNLYINRPTESNIGLFSKIGRTGYVRRVRLRDADISGKDNVGGIAGFNEFYIASSSVTGTIMGNWNVGGIVGASVNDRQDPSITTFGSVQNSYSIANVSGDSRVGGIVGWNPDGVLISVYSRGNITGNNQIGGLVGYGQGYVDYTGSYFAGTVSGNTNVGGLIGEVEAGLMKKLYWDADIAGVPYAIGSSGASFNFGGRTSQQMKIQATYETWDFTDTWEIPEGGGYPTLQVIPEEN